MSVNRPGYLCRAALLAAVAAAPLQAQARIKLVTLPVRERVEIQLEHDQVTLVEEERIIPLAAGVNEIDFAWSLAAIHKDSIQFRALTDPAHIKVLSVSYPPNENALVWKVASPQAVSARVTPLAIPRSPTPTIRTH